MIDAHGWPQLLPFFWDRTVRVLRRTEQLAGGKVVLLHISSSGTTLDVDVADPGLDPSELAGVERAVRWMVELDEDFSGFYAYCRGEPALQHIPGRGLGPMLRGSTVWEDYVKTVSTTNTTWAQTKAMVARLVDAYGALSRDGVSRAFPTPESIAATQPDAFAAAVRAGYRAPYLYATALDIAEGRLDLERFRERAREVETSALMAELRKLRGIGPYAAAHMALLLGSYGYVPVDSWARAQVSRYFNGGAPVSDRDVHAHFDRFGHWKALAFLCWDWDGAA
jgi:3-methyladenine DNA glycosylase/8-oxoguanine DNA glycosylase